MSASHHSIFHRSDGLSDAQKTGIFKDISTATRKRLLSAILTVGDIRKGVFYENGQMTTSRLMKHRQ